jgi:heterodisulfide reductase subunit A2
MKNKDVIIIGGGPAGLESAYQLARQSFNVTVFEKDIVAGGHLSRIFKLFPNFLDADEIREEMLQKSKQPGITVRTGSEITTLEENQGDWQVTTASGETTHASAVILATGFKLFEARYKEELGYGIYKDVITTVEMEQMIRSGIITTADGRMPKRIVFVNCVGSRDEKAGNHYCSRVCCINAVKQSIEVKELLPETDVYCFYMDIRMAGQFYEELYRKSQEVHNVNYIRGRVSEASETPDKRIQIKAEDTLSQLPMKMTVDLLVLMVGVEASEGTSNLGGQTGISGEYGFARSQGLLITDNHTIKKGLFLAGCCKRPLTFPETMADARAAALEVSNYLNQE